MASVACDSLQIQSVMAGNPPPKPISNTNWGDSAANSATTAYQDSSWWAGPYAISIQHSKHCHQHPCYCVCFAILRWPMIAFSMCDILFVCSSLNNFFCPWLSQWGCKSALCWVKEDLQINVLFSLIFLCLQDQLQLQNTAHKSAKQSVLTCCACCETHNQTNRLCLQEWHNASFFHVTDLAAVRLVSQYRKLEQNCCWSMINMWWATLYEYTHRSHTDRLP